ncbi:Type III pantothenate kinase [Rickettsiales bacterium Ac37b]|nr:Type III pantothenate kinase [Rickettsiales bacterium Ac37b]
MLLAIDVGNTNIVFAVFDQEEMVGKWRMATVRGKTSDEYMVFIIQMLSITKLDYNQINSVIIATVVPNLLFDLKNLCKDYFRCKPLIVHGNSLNLNIKLTQEKPHEVGADLIANAVAGYKNFGGDIIIIDFGTATTFQVIDDVGNYVGVVIAPGVELISNSLSLETAKLPKISIETPEKVIGNTTVVAMQSGIYWGYVGLIEKIINKIEQEYTQELKIIATGGMASLFKNSIMKLEYLEPDLTMYGLMYIYYMNKSK